MCEKHEFMPKILIYLKIISDFSGTVDGRELETSLRRRGFNFSPDIFQYVIYEMSRRTGINGINFDLYVRVTAKIGRAHV